MWTLPSICGPNLTEVRTEIVLLWDEVYTISELSVSGADVFQGCTCLFYRLFYYLEDVEVLDPCNELHLFALHFVYLPRIQRSLDHFRNAYLNHPLSSCHNQSPAHLYYVGFENNIEHNRRVADQVYQVFIPVNHVCICMLKQSTCVCPHECCRYVAEC